MFKFLFKKNKIKNIFFYYYKKIYIILLVIYE